MKLTYDNKYTNMQKDFYSKLGNPMYHNAPKVNKLKELDYMFEGHKGKAFEFGCGLGRNIVNRNNQFKRIDGCDLNPGYIKRTEQILKDTGIVSTLYITDGISLNEVKSNEYDLVFSITVLQHIPVYTIRFNILKEMYRVLKKGGWISIQMGYGKRINSTNYYDDYWDAKRTNSAHDVRVDNPKQIREDLEKTGFKDFEYKTIKDVQRVGDAHEKWIMFKARR